MTRILTAAVLIPLALLAIFKAPLWGLTIVVAAVALVATAEYLRIVAGHNLDPLRVPTFLLAGTFFLIELLSALLESPHAPMWVIAHQQTFQAILRPAPFVFFVLSPLLYLAIGLRIKPLSAFLPSAAAGALGLFYIAFPLGRLLGVMDVPHGSLLVFYCLVVVWTGDIAAYYTGRAVGRHLLAPNVSPKKTWEGAVASFLCSVVVGSLLLVKSAAVAAFFSKIHLLNAGDIFARMQSAIQNSSIQNSWSMAILASASINIAAQLGDLVESAMKRGANIKDSGGLLPGHGGILDRIDALLFAAPVLWYYATSKLIHF